MSVYDIEAVYDEQISPLMRQIIAICKKHEMPVVASFCYSVDDAGGDHVANTVLQFEDRTPERHQHALRAIYGKMNAPGCFAMTMTTVKTGNVKRPANDS